MDSVSQFALGAAIGEATLGRSLGRRVLIVGGLLGTLPDLDVLVHYSDAVASFTYHRSWSHSLFVLALISPFLAWLLHRFYPARWLPDQQATHSSQQLPGYSRWCLCVFLVLTTHPVLDGFTVYGTQLFWPLPVDPVAWSSVFIIDPLYTLPLLIGIWVALRNRALARNAVLTALLLSSFYLFITVLSQRHARLVAHASLQAQNIGTANVLIAPAPFSLLWRIVAMDGSTYHEGFYSLLDKDKVVQFKAHDSHRDLIDSQLTHWPIARLDWFTNGMISASKVDNNLIINDLRMGVEASYVFRFKVGQWSGMEFQPLESVQMPIQLDNDRMRRIVTRTWNEHVNVDP